MKNFLYLTLLFASAALFKSCEAEKFKYTNYKLIRLYPNDLDQVKFINDQEERDNKFDIWSSKVVGDENIIEVLLSPEKFVEYSTVFNSRRIQFQVVNHNIQDLIDEEAESLAKNANSRSILFTYARYTEIIYFIDETARKNADIASTQVIGTTAEGRILKVIKLRRGNPTRSIWIDCGIHAREWVTPATCVYIIDQLISELRSNNPIVTALFNKYDFHILPLHNPDGYEYTHTDERLWRKNRKILPGTNCRGIDLNRNFPTFWLTGGSSLDPCSITHAGPYAASELETQAVMKYIMDRHGHWDSFLNIHSYGNWWLTPYGHTVSELPPDYKLMMDAAQVGVEAIRAFNGSEFTAGSSSQLLYVVTGGSSDWAYNEMGITYSYVLELRPGSGTPEGEYGFELPVDYMPLVAPETYLGIRAFLNYISSL